jgi:hypothetical protein
VATDWRAGVGFPAGRDLSLLHSVLTGSEAHPDSYTKCTGVMRQRSEADHSSPSIAEVKNDGATPPLPHTSSNRGA